VIAAVAQLAAVPGDVGANVAAHVGLVERAGAAGAALVVFPELSLTGYELERIAAEPQLALRPDDPRLAPLREACVAAGTTAVAGAPVDGELAAIVLHGDGRAPDVYGKQNLDGPERDVFRAGTRTVVVEAGGRRVGLGICVDANHPEHAAAAAAAGAEVYAAGVIFKRGTEARMAANAAARARETGMWVLFAQPSGVAGPFDTTGGSGIWAPGGEPVVRLGAEAPAIGVAELA
jgi:predicted amidohydrolase